MTPSPEPTPAESPEEENAAAVQTTADLIADGRDDGIGGDDDDADNNGIPDDEEGGPDGNALIAIDDSTVLEEGVCE